MTTTEIKPVRAWVVWSDTGGITDINMNQSQAVKMADYYGDKAIEVEIRTVGAPTDAERALAWLYESGCELRPDLNGGWDLSHHDDFTGKITHIVIQARTPLQAILSAMDAEKKKDV